MALVGEADLRVKMATSFFNGLILETKQDAQALSLMFSYAVDCFQKHSVWPNELGCCSTFSKDMGSILSSRHLSMILCEHQFRCRKSGMLSPTNTIFLPQVLIQWRFGRQGTLSKFVLIISLKVMAQTWEIAIIEAWDLSFWLLEQKQMQTELNSSPIKSASHREYQNLLIFLLLKKLSQENPRPLLSRSSEAKTDRQIEATLDQPTIDLLVSSLLLVNLAQYGEGA